MNSTISLCIHLTVCLLLWVFIIVGGEVILIFITLSCISNFLATYVNRVAWMDASLISDQYI